MTAADPPHAGARHPTLDLLQEAGARLRAGVAAVGEGMHDQVVHLQRRRQLDQGAQMTRDSSAPRRPRPGR